jgi:hypothetical protein
VEGGYHFQLIDEDGDVLGTYEREALEVRDVATAANGRQFEVLEETAVDDGGSATACYRIRWLS